MSTTDERMETIRGSLEHLDAESVRDALALVLSRRESTVDDQQSSLRGAPNSLGDDLERAETLAQVIRLLKQRLSVAGLGKLSVEGEVVWVTIGNRRYQLTDDTDSATRPSDGAPRPSAAGQPSGGRTAAGADGSSRDASDGGAPGKAAPSNGAERFRNLEL